MFPINAAISESMILPNWSVTPSTQRFGIYKKTQSIGNQFFKPKFGQNSCVVPNLFSLHIRLRSLPCLPYPFCHDLSWFINIQCVFDRPRRDFNFCVCNFAALIWCPPDFGIYKFLEIFWDGNHYEHLNGDLNFPLEGTLTPDLVHIIGLKAFPPIWIYL